MSAIPAAIDKLVVMFGLIGPKVLDGPPAGVWPDEDVILVGWLREGTGRNGVGISVENVEGFVSTDAETFTVSCLISVVGGDLELAPLRSRAVGFYDQVGAAIRGDPTLLGSVAHAVLTVMSMRQFLNKESGGSVELDFDIACTAFL